MARLTSLPGKGPVLSFTLLQSTGLGRDPRNLIHLPDDSVSRFHAEIRKQGGMWLLVDLGSSNGTFLNDKRIEREPLSDGDRVSVGIHSFVFEDEPEEDERPGVTIHRSFTREILADELARHRKQSLERFDDFIAICEVCASPASVERFASDLVKRLESLLEADAVHVVLLGADEEPRVFVPDRSAFVPLDDGPAISGTILDTAVVRAEAVLMRDPSAESRFANRASIVGGGVTTALAVPIMTGDRVAGVVYAHRQGAALPFDEEELRLLHALSFPIGAALATLERIERVEVERRKLRKMVQGGDILGEDPSILKVQNLIARVAPLDSTVLITGETGTGKELVARAIHENSKRSSGPFEAINCAAFSETLVESELFGHEKGAFTGAIEARQGAFGIAEGGTLFLDEIGELPLPVQAKLLRVLETREVKRVGGSNSRKVDVRLVAATNRNLEEMVESGAFRRDLFFRVNVFTIHIAPLRERKGDIPLLADHFVSEFAARMGIRELRLSRDSQVALAVADWTGNVRELKNSIERACILADGPVIRPGDLGLSKAGRSRTDEPAELSTTALAEMTLGDLEKLHITAVLKSCNGNKSLAAQKLGIDRSTLYAKLKAFDIA